MALINCPECGKEISDKATSCPNCGNPMNNKPKETIAEEKAESYLCCPKCGSRELHAEHKGFSGSKALAGAVAVGGIGLLAGTIGSKDVLITCLKCGNQFKAGEGRIVETGKSAATFRERKYARYICLGQRRQAIYEYQRETKCSYSKASGFVDRLSNRIDKIFTEEELAQFREQKEKYHNSGCVVVLAFMVILSALMSFYV